MATEDDVCTELKRTRGGAWLEEDIQRLITLGCLVRMDTTNPSRVLVYGRHDQLAVASVLGHCEFNLKVKTAAEIRGS